MALFKKRRDGGRQPADEALDFMTRPEADEFRAMIRAVFADIGLEVVIHADHAVDDQSRQFGFCNIAAQCHHSPRDEWRQHIERHVHRVIESMDAPSPFEGLSEDEARYRTYPRLMHADDLPMPDAVPHQGFAPGIVELLALDLPESVAFFGHDEVRRLGGFDRLRAAGVANLADLAVDRVETFETDDGGRFHALLGDSVYTGSRALLLPSLAQQLTGETPGEHGWLMSVPNRHQVVWHLVRDASLIASINRMLQFTMLGYQDSPGPVSPHVYWWNDFEYEQLSQIADDGTVSIEVGPRFHEVLELLVADPDAGEAR